jgi:tripartite ATP-independent transporter DctM subunit
MSATLILTAVCLIVLLLTGLPIAFCMALSGIVGTMFHMGPAAILQMGAIPFSYTSGFSLLAIPMFVLMGNILLEYGIGSVLFELVNKLVGKTRGGLAMATTVMCALFGFACGSSSASCATIGGNTLPEMEKRGYDRRLSVGVLAIAGSLAILIPPSIIMVVYSILAETSLGAVMIAGILPGLLLTTLIMAYIYIRVTIDPALAPINENSYSMKDKIKSLVGLLPIAALFLAIVGGLFLGYWDAIEASSVGVFMALIICIIYFRHVSWTVLKRALIGSVNTTVMIYMLIVGGNMLAYVFYVTGLQAQIGNFVAGLGVPGWLVIITMGIILMILGTFLDVIAMLTVTVPIFLPIVLKLGYDPVWFGIIATLFSEMAMITPPVGVNLFVIQGIAPAGTTLKDVAAGAAPYVGVIWIMAILLIMFPSIALYLPSLME